MQRLFPDEEHCAAYLEALRWPEGFVCRFCGWTGAPYRFRHRASVLRCRHCQRDTALTAGTVMQKTRTPLSVWFWTAFLVTTQTPGMSALQIQRQLGLSRYETVFQMLHKLRAAMVRPDHDAIGAEHPVEIDETYVGGRTRGEGRGIHHQSIVIGAVEVRDAVGNILQDGDTVTVIKDLKVRGATSSLKVGTKVRGIRLVDGDHNIDCKIDGFGAMQLKIGRAHV